MHKLLLAATMALALMGCASTHTSTSSTGGTAAVVTKTDTKIAEVSEVLAKQCVLLNVAVAAGQTFSHSEKVQKALAIGKAGLDEFCAAPPTDTASAIDSVRRIYLAVSQTLATKET